MPKRVLSASELFDLRLALQMATLEALLSSKRWQPAQLAFQGGTSLHLAHGSPRFSEDLDFLVDAALNLDSIDDGVRRRLSAAEWLPKDMQIAVSKIKSKQRLRTFEVTAAGANVLGSARVKVEMWQTPALTMQSLGIVVKPVRLARGPLAGAQTFVPAEDIRDIFVDKVFALAARPYLKARDVFDLYWISKNQSGLCFDAEDLSRRFDIYPGEAVHDWLCKADERDALLGEEKTLEAVTQDLGKWLPATWKLQSSEVCDMLQHSRSCLQRGMQVAQQLLDDDEQPCGESP